MTFPSQTAPNGTSLDTRDPSNVDTPLLGDIAPDEFRRHAKRVLQWIGDYLERPERYPVLPRVVPGEIAGTIPTEPPLEPESLDHVLDDFERLIVPGVTHWNHPGFFAYFAISASAPGILAEMLIAALNGSSPSNLIGSTGVMPWRPAVRW